MRKLINELFRRMGAPPNPRWDEDWGEWLWEWVIVTVVIAVVWGVMWVCKAVGL